MFITLSGLGATRKLLLLSVLLFSFGLAGCDGDDGDDGEPGPPGTDGISCWDLNENGVKDLPDEDLNGDGVVDVNDCNPNTGGGQGITIGDGSELTEEEIEELGQLVATIDDVEVSSPPVVTFTVTDSSGNPANGIAEGVVWFTFAKLVPASPDANGGLSYWQSYVNRVETADPGANTPNVLDQAVQATTDSAGTLESLGGGRYRYTFATDVTNVTDPIAVAWEPSLTHRVGLEIRLDGPGEVPLAPDNPVYDFVPDGGAGSGVTKEIADTANCNDCHYSFALHGGPRKTVEYCVTCHNPGSIDQDTGESIDMAYLSHSIHTGEDRATPYIVYGFRDFIHDYSEVGYPQDTLYCETCHEASESTPDGDSWNEVASTTTCGGCHADGLVVENPDAVTGAPEYAFDHTASNADADLGKVVDGECGNCHLGNIERAGPALAIHSSIRGSNRARGEAGDNFVLEILGASNTGPGETPEITFRVSSPDGEPYDIVEDPEFSDSNASLNLYVAWTTDDVYNGDENGTTGGWRDRGDGAEPVDEQGYPYRMYLGALQRDAERNGDGSYTVTYFRALPENISGDPMIALGGHPAWEFTDADGVTDFDRAAAVSAVFYPGEERQFAVDSDNCNACHEQIQFHGGNRNGNVEICLACHTADTAVEGEGWAFGLLVHSIHASSESYAGGEFAHVTYPQNIANCETCHVEGSYSAARETARAVSTSEGGDTGSWLDDTATTPNATACGACHTSAAARGHFESQSGQVGDRKSNIAGAESGMPNGQEACAVCHGTGREYDTALFHNPGVGE
jgi:OmcA/MtrC family decaheme c-type cytochrome